jgi:hypothetical protein
MDMAGQVRSALVDGPTAPAKLKVRAAPYWTKLGSKGSHLGYHPLGGQLWNVGGAVARSSHRQALSRGAWQCR